MRNIVPGDNEFPLRQLHTLEHPVEGQATHCEAGLSVLVLLKHKPSLIPHANIKRDYTSLGFLPHYLTNGKSGDEGFGHTDIDVIKRHFLQDFRYKVSNCEVTGFVGVFLDIPRSGGYLLHQLTEARLNLLIVKKTLINNERTVASLRD
jgi:hypothetical protein